MQLATPQFKTSTSFSHQHWKKQKWSRVSDKHAASPAAAKERSEPCAVAAFLPNLNGALHFKVNMASHGGAMMRSKCFPTKKSFQLIQTELNPFNLPLLSHVPTMPVLASYCTFKNAARDSEPIPTTSAHAYLSQ